MIRRNICTFWIALLLVIPNARGVGDTVDKGDAPRSGGIIHVEPAQGDPYSSAQIPIGKLARFVASVEGSEEEFTPSKCTFIWLPSKGLSYYIDSSRNILVATATKEGVYPLSVFICANGEERPIFWSASTTLIVGGEPGKTPDPKHDPPSELQEFSSKVQALADDSNMTLASQNKLADVYEILANDIFTGVIQTLDERTRRVSAALGDPLLTSQNTQSFIISLNTLISQEFPPRTYSSVKDMLDADRQKYLAITTGLRMD